MLFNTVIARILIAILTFLSVVFPNNKGLTSTRQQYENSSSKWAPIIMEAVKEKDVKTVESLMCKNIKDNTKDLSGEIQALYDCIEGDIVSIDWQYRGGDYSETHRDGKSISQVCFEIIINTTVDEYSIGITWETVNNFQPDETKIRNMGLIFRQEPYERLYIIRATEGVFCWHE